MVCITTPFKLQIKISKLQIKMCEGQIKYLTEEGDIFVVPC